MSNGKFGDDGGAGIELSSDAILPLADRRRYPFLDPPLAPEEIGRAGDYRILRAIGAGGMGIVFAAEDTILHRPVALKVLRPELASDPENRERFLREARATAALASDNIVTVFQVGVVNGVPYLAEQFLPGESLQDRLDRTALVDLRSSLVIARGAAAGLAAAHAAGLIHRDIKPANIWLESDASGEFLRARLLDFGLARRMTGEASLTGTGVIVGTPNFMSPEHANDQEIDHRADLFSLGAVLYTMIAGELPFPGKSAMAAMVAVTTRPVPRLSEKYPAMPRGVSALVAQLLAKEPNDRPQTAREAMAILDAEIARLPETMIPSLSPPHLFPMGIAETVGPSASITRMDAEPVPARRHGWRWAERIAGSSVTLALIVLVVYLAFVRDRNPDPATQPSNAPIKVGVLHSRKGSMAVSENSVVDATLLAIAELNAEGGVLGRTIEPVVLDGQSKPDEFGRLAETLLNDKVAAIFGCWTSASRRAVQDVLQHRNEGLLFYPVQYEGLGDCPRIIYLGPAPNQQLTPAIEFLIRPVASGGLGKKRLYLVGSDYLFPRVAHEIIRDLIKPYEKDGVQIVGEMFVPLGSEQTKVAVDDIDRTQPDAIVNTINGRSNGPFFLDLRAKGYTPDKVPTLSVSITENEVMGLNPATMAGDYLAASYFQNIDRAESREFLRKLRARYGASQVATDPMAAAYTAVRIWARAVEETGSTDPTTVRDALRGMVFEGVRARLTIDRENQHAWLPARIGRIRPDGLVDLVPGAGSETPIRPIPFPPTRKPEEWNQYLKSLQFKWDGKWQPPEN